LDTSAATWLVVVLALVCANLPFLNQRFFMLIPLAKPQKHGFVRLLELMAYYLIVGLAAYFLEASNSAVTSQGPWFYPITICIFLVFAFPGFVYCFLLKRRS
jgi:hypothetical protein